MSCGRDVGSLRTASVLGLSSVPERLRVVRDGSALNRGGVGGSRSTGTCLRTRNRGDDRCSEVSRRRDMTRSRFVIRGDNS